VGIGVVGVAAYFIAAKAKSKSAAKIRD
jgi:hypothetical protein